MRKNEDETHSNTLMTSYFSLLDSIQKPQSIQEVPLESDRGQLATWFFRPRIECHLCKQCASPSSLISTLLSMRGRRYHREASPPTYARIPGKRKIPTDQYAPHHYTTHTIGRRTTIVAFPSGSPCADQGLHRAKAVPTHSICVAPAQPSYC